MTDNWVHDISEMHRHYGFHEKVAELDDQKLRDLLEFRINFLQEEMTELTDAETAEDVVDALIDLCVVAIGTLDLFRVDGYKAWNEVHKANMAKAVGIKASRPNPLGLPDLIKPEGWVTPSHEGNHGDLPTAFEDEITDNPLHDYYLRNPSDAPLGSD